MNVHPYKVTYVQAGQSWKYISYVPAGNAAHAKGQIKKRYGRLLTGPMSARKQALSKCAFYKHFGKAATELHFGVKL